MDTDSIRPNRQREKPLQHYANGLKNTRLALAGSYIACEEQPRKESLSCKNPTYLQPRILPHARRRMLTITTNDTSSGWARDRSFHVRQPTSHNPYRGWNILLLVCYDLRFPVWSRNTAHEYDLLIYVANWPVPRRKVWDILLQARALENISYVCGVNRIGKDGKDIPTQRRQCGLLSKGGSAVATVPDNEEATATASLNLSSLQEFRLKFPAWKDADEFVISQIIVHSSHYTYAFNIRRIGIAVTIWRIVPARHCVSYPGYCLSLLQTFRQRHGHFS